MSAWPPSLDPRRPADGRSDADAPPVRRPLLAYPVMRPLAWLMLQGLLLVLGLMSVGWNLVALLLYPVLPRERGLVLGRAVIAWGYGVFWRLARAAGMLYLDADALDALREERGLVVVANHPSLLDAVMLVARLPRSACIMKASIARNPLLGPGARLARYIRNDSTRGMVQRAVQDLKAGGQLVLFPEGTRSPPGGLHRFESAFTLIARHAKVPIQAVFIDTDSPYLGKGWPLWRLPPLPIRFAVRLGPRYDPSDEHHALRCAVESDLRAGLNLTPLAPVSARNDSPD